MKTIFIFLLALSNIFIVDTAFASQKEDKLQFDSKMRFKETEITLPTGEIIKYRTYENIYYVTNIEDSTYQYLNIFVPESAYNNNTTTPIFLRTYIGGYMAAKAAQPSANDATGRALKEGYVVVIPGSRGSNSKIVSAGKEIYTGKAPAGLLDLKSAIRYLRHNNGIIPGNAERIIIDGTSAGGAMSSLIGATGNNPIYDNYLNDMGAANERDDVFAVLSFCPITDLEHADMAYEWLYSETNTGLRKLSVEQITVSEELAAMYPDYLNSLNLKMPNGTPLTDKNYKDYIKSFLIKSAQKAKDAGANLPTDAGIVMSEGFRGKQGEFVTDIDLATYLDYVVRSQPLKTPPAFDPMNVITSKPSPENSVFGDKDGNSANLTDYSFQKAMNNPSATISSELKERIYLMNPMNFIGDNVSKIAPNWYIRHGAIDRDTGFEISINLYTKLLNNGYNPNFELAWNKPHTGDYSLNEVFEWIKTIIEKGN